MREDLRIVMTGDIHVRRTVEVSPLITDISTADCVFANLEGPACEKGTGYPSDKTVLLKTDPRWLDQLPSLGVRVVSLANNHMMDYGPAALEQTIRALDERGIRHTGAGLDEAAAFRPARIQCRGVDIAFLSFCCTLPPNYRATDGRPGVAGIRVRSSFEPDLSRMEEEPGSASLYVHTDVFPPDLGKVREAVRRASRDADIVIVGMHWGVSLGWTPVVQGQTADYQRPLADVLAGAGADILCGGHAHAINGVCRIENCVVGYSQGNFIWHPHASTPARLTPPYKSVEEPDWKRQRKREGYLLEAIIDRARTGRTLKEVRVVPYFLDDRGDPQRGSIEYSEEILGRLAGYAESSKIGKRWNSENGKATIQLC
ncbi:MAG: CapA family protein [Spirochaetales bacterium]|nr:CapA family protein [Spirochaetales bacterium]